MKTDLYVWVLLGLLNMGVLSFERSWLCLLMLLVCVVFTAKNLTQMLIGMDNDVELA